MSRVTVTVITPLFNGLRYSRQMLASLESTWPTAISREVIFVDNGSTDGTAEWLKSGKRKGYRVISNVQNLGFSVANNQAARIAKGEFLLLINNDVVLLPGWLEPMLETMRRTGAVVVGNVQKAVRTGGIDHAGIYFDGNGSPFHLRPPESFIKNLDVLDAPAATGACLLIKRSWFESVGGFDETYRNSYEDVDLCMKARTTGKALAISTKSVVYHFIGASKGRQDWEPQNAKLFEQKWKTQSVAFSAVKAPNGFDHGPFHKNGATTVSREYAVFQAYFPTETGYSEPRSYHTLYPTKCWTRVTVPIPAWESSRVPLRLDPCRFSAIVQVAGVGFRDVCSGKLIAVGKGARLSEMVKVTGTGVLKPEPGHWMTVECSGEDPQVILKLPEPVDRFVGSKPLDIELVLRNFPLR